MRNCVLVAALLAAIVPLSSAQAASRNGFTVRSTTMLAGPDFNYPAVQRLRGNVGITVYGCLRDWSWCDVGDYGSRGWVAGHDIVIDYQGRRQSIMPTMGIGVLSFVLGSYWGSHYRSRPFYSQRPRFKQQYNSDQRPQWGPHPRAPRGVAQPGQARHDPQQSNARVPNAAPHPAPGMVPQQHQRSPVPRPNGPAEQRPAQNQPRPQMHQGGAGHGNANTVQRAGQQRDGRSAGPQNRPDQNQRPPH